MRACVFTCACVSNMFLWQMEDRQHLQRTHTHISSQASSPTLPAFLLPSLRVSPFLPSIIVSWAQITHVFAQFCSEGAHVVSVCLRQKDSGVSRVQLQLCLSFCLNPSLRGRCQIQERRLTHTHTHKSADIQNHTCLLAHKLCLLFLHTNIHRQPAHRCY